MSLVNGLPPEFSKHFAAWTRLEPRCRRDDFSQGLQARVADPLWMLGRQSQTAEFSAEDAGSAIDVKLSYATQPLARVRLGSQAEIVSLPSMPLVALVEQEHTDLSWRDRVQIGQQFEQLLREVIGAAGGEAAIGAYRSQKENHGPGYAFRLVAPVNEQEWAAIDRATRRFLKLADGHVVDGTKVLSRIDFDDPTAHRMPLLGGTTAAQMQRVVSALFSWCVALNIRPQPARAAAWRNPHLDYRFEIDPPDGAAAATHLNLVAPEYRNGELDWHTFNVAGAVPVDWTFSSTPSIVPQRASVGGSSSRWWAFEDAATDFGSIEVSRPDLARLLLMEYVLVHGDDWFVVPLTVHMPCVVCVEKVVVRNVFGEFITAGPARNADADPLRRFDLFGLSTLDAKERPGIGAASAAGASAAGNSLLLIPPVAGYREESAALEELRFLRDEGANKVWAVEHVVRNGVGRPVDGFDAQGERVQRMRELRLSELEAMLRAKQSRLEDTTLGDAERKRLDDECKALGEVISEFRNR